MTTPPRKRKTTRDRPLALGYIRVSTDEQVETGGSLAGQESALRKYCDLQEWDLEMLGAEGMSGKSLAARPVITAGLARLANGDADHLLAVAMDRLSRSVRDVADLMDRSVREGWGLVTIRENIDTSTAMGRAMVQMAGVMAELERGLISERTKAGMAAKRAAGGRPPGRVPPLVSLAAAMRAQDLKDQGLKGPEIGSVLTQEGWRTSSGRSFWTEPSVRSALHVAKSQSPPVFSGTATGQ